MRLTELSKFLVINILLLCSTQLASANAMVQLDEYLKKTNSGVASFQQTLITPATKQQPAREKKSSGSFSFLRPNLFKFSYTQPYQQQIISDGKFLWTYDVDLAQATKQNLQQAINSSAISLIINAKNLTDLNKEFDIKTISDNKKSPVIELTPKQENGQIIKVILSLAQQQIKRLEITNNFGQISILDFTYYKKLVKINDFTFKPGQDIDVVDNSKQW